MRNGDLSNAPVPRYVVVFENALGYLPDDRRGQWRKLSRRGRWDDVARLFDLDPLMMRQIARLTHLHAVSIDVVTYCGPADFAAALSRRFDDENLPVRRVFASNPEKMARTTSYEPDIMVVYDANPGHARVYGPKGVLLKHHDQLGGS
jgi:hypothetical protein